MHALEIRLFGGFELRVGDAPISRLESRKVESLLAYLATHQGRAHAREVLVGMFWPEMAEDKARTNLRRALYVIRKTVGADGEFLLAEGNQVRFDADSDHWLDVHAFEGLVAQPAAGTELERRNQLEQAAALYRGPFMDGYYDDWVFELQQRYAGLHLEALEQLAEHQAKLGELEAALECCQQMIGLQSGYERAYRQKMRYHYHLGQQQQALQTYRACVLTLQNLDTQPASETHDLYEQILKHELPAAPRVVANNLPQQLTRFVGREAELEEIGSLLAGDDCRLLTLIGPGGMGKTRLALQAASNGLQDFEDGVFFVPLAEVGSAELVVPAIVQTLNLSTPPGADPKQRLIDYVREKRMLWVLDNFEHLLEGAGDLAAVLERAPGLNVLVTSRESVKLHGEWVLELSGLNVPEDETGDLEAFSAVELFAQSARRIHSRFTLDAEARANVVEICRMVQGVPLAIELAATWVRVLSCHEIFEEIQQNLGFLTSTSTELPVRHRSLQAVFEHSWKLLSKEERRVLRKLSVFQGGFSKRAAEVVAEASVSVLLGLIYKSLLQRNNAGFYEMLDVIRQYAAAKLEKAAGELEKTLTLHASHYAEQVRQRVADLKGGRQLEAVRAMAHEIGNLRVGWHWAVVNKARAKLGDFLDGLHLYFELTGAFQEGGAAFRQAAEQLSRSRDDRLVGRLLARQGFFSERCNDFDSARVLIKKSLKRLRRAEVPAELAFALNALGTVEDILGNFDTAQTAYDESLVLYQRGNDDWGLSRVLTNLGILNWERGDYAQAKTHYRQSLELCEKLDDRWGIARGLNNLGGVAYALGALDEAQTWYERSLAAYEALDHRWGVANVLNNLGAVTKAQQDFSTARDYHQQNLDMCREMGDQAGQVYALKNIGDVGCMLGHLDKAAVHYRDALNLAAELELTPMILEIFTGVAMLRMETEAPEAAVAYAECALHHPASYQEVKDKAQGVLDEVQHRLSKQAWAEAQDVAKQHAYEDLLQTALAA